ncbi:unnamed protein product, partial [Prunus brigantina]
MLSCFNCPKQVCKEMNSCCRHFFWGNNTKVPPVAWKDICLPQNLGGLGVRSVDHFNQAALAKLGWICLMDSSNWWAHIVAKKYLKKDGFLEVAKKTAHSSAWKAILDAHSVLHKGIRWMVGNGQSIHFWTANLVFPFPLLDLIPSHPKAPLLKKMWSLTLPPKVKIFSWLFIRKRLQILAYLNCRYISPYEAVWRLFQYPIHSREPAVERLSIHLPLEQNVVFNGDQSLESIVSQKGIEDTMLTSWFKANQMFPEARTLTYAEFPTKFVWDSRNKIWKPRKKRRSIGRIAYVHPASGELYYLRMLLNLQKGALNFDHIKTIDGIIHPSYQAACKCLGLLGDDKEWIEALANVVDTASCMPIMLLRNLNQSSGLCNGTRLVVTQMVDRVIEAKILTGSHIGHKVFIPRIILSATENKWPFIFKRRQFPIRPCYAMTINKSQGQSLKQVGLYLPQPVFTHGQLYVALSRATSREGLKIIIDNNNEVPNKYTKNIVYKDVLQNLLSGFSFYSYMIKHSSILCNNFLCIFILTKGIYFFPKDAQQNFDGINCLAQLLHTKDSDGPNALSKALLLCWQIWEARNNCILKDIVPHPARALLVVGHIGLDYWKINSCPSQKSNGLINIKRQPPPLD